MPYKSGASYVPPSQSDEHVQMYTKFDMHFQEAHIHPETHLWIQD